MIRFILNIIWLVLFGWILFLGYMLAGVLLSITIIGIPWSIASLGSRFGRSGTPLVRRRTRAWRH